MTPLPRLFFKYRPLSDDKLINRSLQIIDNHELYFPNRKSLNDPFEGINGRFWVPGSGYAGISMPVVADEEIPFVAEIRNKYKILSLSEDCFSPLMWALYADEGRGLCFCFRSDGSFRKANTVAYREPDTSEKTIPLNELEKAIEEDLYTKSQDWQYEKEWRIIEQSEDSHFRFKREELVAVVFGYQINPETKETIKRALPRGTKLFKTHAGRQTKRIRLLPDDYEIVYDGNEPAFINTISELCDAVFNCEQDS